MLPQETRSHPIRLLSGVAMNLSATTKQQIRQMQTKLKHQLTGRPLFSSDAALIDYAIDALYKDLKARRLL